MDWIVPMSPILVPEVTHGEDYIHQVKWDGIRGLSYIENGTVKVFTKQGRNRTLFYPELNGLPSMIRGRKAVLDGEIIILNEDMKPSFQLSLIRERVSDPRRVNYYADKYPIRYIVFDMLALDDGLLTQEPFSRRDMLLREYFDAQEPAAITDNFNDGTLLFSLMKEKGWEGIVSKNVSSPYLPAKTHRAWFKTKLSRRILAIVAGLTLKEGIPNSLILAVNGSEGLVYIGRASIGLTQEHFRLLKDNIHFLKAEKKPLSITSGEPKNTVWLEPRLTAWISFLERTSDGGLRHPKVIGFSSLPPEEATGKEFVE